MKKHTILTALLLFPIVVLAQENIGDPNEIGICVAAKSLLDKIILYGSSLIVTIVAALFSWKEILYWE